MIKLKQNGLYVDTQDGSLLQFIFTNAYMSLHYFLNEYHQIIGVYNEELDTLDYATKEDVKHFNKAIAINAVSLMRH